MNEETTWRYTTNGQTQGIWHAWRSVDGYCQFSSTVCSLWQVAKGLRGSKSLVWKKGIRCWEGLCSILKNELPIGGWKLMDWVQANQWHLRNKSANYPINQLLASMRLVTVVGGHRDLASTVATCSVLHVSWCPLAWLDQWWCHSRWTTDRWAGSTPPTASVTIRFCFQKPPTSRCTAHVVQNTYNNCKPLAYISNDYCTNRCVHSDSRWLSHEMLYDVECSPLAFMRIRSQRGVRRGVPGTWLTPSHWEHANKNGTTWLTLTCGY